MNSLMFQNRASGATNQAQQRFAQVPAVEQQRSNFDRSHQYKTTLDAGLLIPFFVDEVLPGDTFALNSTLLARLGTPIVPIMDNLYIETHYFFVPNRLIWSNFEKFMGARTNPEDHNDYIVPQLTDSDSGTHLNFESGSIADYFGLPVGVDIAYESPVSSLPFRAYNLIWNEWFRDQNLQDSLPVPMGDGPDHVELFNIMRRGKRHDYFTSALPWPQKGPGVELPLGSTAPLLYGVPDGSFPPSQPLYDSIGNDAPPGAVTADTTINGTRLRADGTTAFLDVSGSHYVDLSDATAATINSLRQAFQIQRMLERDARGGTRYIEILKAHFGVTSPDYRLQRPEYLGGGSTPINVHPIPQQSSTDNVTPQGNLAGVGVGVSNKNGFSKSFVEHGIIIGLVSIRADLTYQQGLPRMFSRQTKYDFYWPALAHLGEQAILNKEIYYTPDAGGVHATVNDEVFGYQERWAEYRYFPSKVTGKFRSSDPQSLDVWHLAQDFSARPVLNAAFIEDNPPVDRVIATPEEPQFLLDVYNQLTTGRVMPTYSVPGLIDHF